MEHPRGERGARSWAAVALVGALAPGLMAYALRRHGMVPWPWLSAGALLPWALAVLPTQGEREERRARQRRLREVLEQLPGGELVEGSLVLPHSAGGKDTLRTVARSLRVRLAGPLRVVPEVRARLVGVLAMERVGLETTPERAEIETASGRVRLDGRLVVFGGSREQGALRGLPWDDSVRSIQDGERVLARGTLVEEQLDEPREGGFRGAPAVRRRLEAMVERDDQGDALSVRVIPVMSLEPPTLRRAVYAGWLLGLLVLSLGGVLAALAQARATKREDVPVREARCGEAAERALERGDPWSALPVLRTCDRPALEARAWWLVGDFAGASAAFARAGLPVASPTEVAAHALAGQWGLAAQAVGRLPREGGDVLGIPRLDASERACLAAALLARQPGATLPATSPLRRPASAVCHALALDLKLLHGLSDAEMPPVARPEWTRERSLDMGMALLPLLDTTQPIEQRVKLEVVAADFDSTAGRDPRVRLRRRPLGFYGPLLEELRGYRPTSEEMRRRKVLLEAEMTPDLALFAAYTGASERVLARLEPLRAYTREPDPPERRRISYGERDSLPPYADWVSMLSHEREMIVTGAWAAYHAGLDEEARTLARQTNDSHNIGMMDRWIELRRGTGAFEATPWRAEEDWHGELFTLASTQDGGPLAAWLRAHRWVSAGAVERVIGHLERDREAVVDAVATWPAVCWDCGLTALVEHAAERRTLARRLGLSDLESRLALVVHRAGDARLRRDLTVPLLLLEREREW